MIALVAAAGADRRASRRGRRRRRLSPRVGMAFFWTDRPAQLDAARPTSLPCRRRRGPWAQLRPGPVARFRCPRRAYAGGPFSAAPGLAGFGLGHSPRFRRLVRDQHLLGRGHHRTNRSGFGLGLAASIAEVGGTRGFFVRAGLGLGRRLFAGFSPALERGRKRRLAASWIGLGLCLSSKTWNLSFDPGLAAMAGEHASSASRSRFSLSSRRRRFSARSSSWRRISSAWRRVSSSTARQFGLVLRAATTAAGPAPRARCFHHGVGAFVPLDEGALLADLHLDRAGLAPGVGLLDLAGGLLHQGDLLAFARGGAVAGLQVAEQLLLVGVAERVGRRPTWLRPRCEAAPAACRWIS